MQTMVKHDIGYDYCLLHELREDRLRECFHDQDMLGELDGLIFKMSQGLNYVS